MQLFPEASLPETTVLVLSVHRYEDKLWLPRFYSVLRDRNGELTYLQKQITRRNAASYGYPRGSSEFELIARADGLSVQHLEEKFAPPRRGDWSLPKILAQPEQLKTLRRFVDRELAALLDATLIAGIPLVSELERRTKVRDLLILPATEQLEPLFYFRRDTEGIRYELRLRIGQSSFRPRETQVQALTGEPARLLIDRRLYAPDHFNGRMVQPFRYQDRITVPEAHLTTYFKKFILKIAKHHPIRAEGFEVTDNSHLRATLLEITQRPGERAFELAVRFQYEYVTFGAADPRTEHLSLEVDEARQIALIRTERNTDRETGQLTRLAALGFERSDAGYFTGPETGDLPQLLADRTAELNAAGFTLLPLQFGNKTVYLHPANYQLSVLTGADWFDVFGTVTVGEFSFPFLKLAPNFRDNNRFYALPNGRFFLIPEEWMARFSGLIQFGNLRERAVRVGRNQYALLRGLDLPVAEEALPDADLTSGLTAPATLKATLRPYQLTGYRWLAAHALNGLGACLADDMGLGKTLQTLAALLFAHENAPAQAATTTDAPPDLFGAQPANPTSLVVLPASLVFNWRAEIERFAPHLMVCTYTGPKRPKDPRVLQTFDVILSTYHTVRRDVDLLSEIPFTYVILDESQQIKNREGQLFRAVTQLNAAHRVSLSGTPIENSLSDLWAQMQFINPDLLGGFGFFKREFIQPIERHGDAHRTQQLRELVQPYLLRRTKEEVAPDLPELTEDILYSEMTTEQRKLYEREKSAARNYLLENFGQQPRYQFQVLQSLLKLRQIALAPALLKSRDAKPLGSKLTDLVTKLVELKRAGSKVLVFSFFVECLNLIAGELRRERIEFVELNGGTSQAARARAVKRFQSEPELPVFLISTKAGGAGLNLTAADYVFIADPWWNPAVEQQAVARAHRIGRERPVFVTRFISRDTIEEKILLLQQKKAKLAGDIIGREGPGHFERADIEFLFG